MRVGVIGTGKMGENHIRTYLSMHEHCQLVGIFDKDEQRANDMANKYNVRQFQSMDNLLQQVDAISIAVPTEYHYPIGLTCIKHNVHILMEKPITSTVVQANDLVKKAKKAGIKLQVGHIELFNPIIQSLIKELTDEKIIGMEFHRMNPYHHRIKNVDVVADLMIHDLYILQAILQDTIDDFHAFGKIIENTPKHAVVIATSVKDIIVQLTASFKSKRKIRSIQILTEDALFDVDIIQKQLKIVRSGITSITVIDDEIEPLHLQLMDFIRCIQNNDQPKVSGEDGIKALQLTNQIGNAISKLN
ncbi:Gfo/Idh/MocA family protein [Virgibacillus salexigens]|uniref:Oxidoreductase n=1 Tax=Virgibacillus kapii TaxID=1638645 RepID=A0ABQ2DQ50_9BACI|nr:Gfo/Idh/MocA family oxidoreductase [Virgibacillus kapii]GGJ67961.1 oxidoreductase [Virgibacillus kapii]